MFVVFTDQGSTANIYTHEFLIACKLQKGCYYAKIKSAKTFLAAVILRTFYTLEIYPLYGIPEGSDTRDFGVQDLNLYEIYGDLNPVV